MAKRKWLSMVISSQSETIHRAFSTKKEAIRFVDKAFRKKCREIDLHASIYIVQGVFVKFSQPNYGYWVVKSGSHGSELGSECGRNGCNGHIVETPPENCSCHINPLCSACVDAGAHCNKYGWELEP